MKSSSSTEFTASEGRRFAFPVGTAFLILAGILFWRERVTLTWIAGGLGATLYVAGVAIPRHLGPVYAAWMRMALAISKVTTPIFMAVVYFIVLTPTGAVMRLFGRRAIVHKPKDGSLWQGRSDLRGDLTRQF